MVIKMLVRKATKEDIPALEDLLSQVLEVHAKGRPDLFRSGCRKYTREELEMLLEDPLRPIFVAEEGRVLGYAFCAMREVREDNIFHDRRELYIDDLCVDGGCRGMGVGKTLFEFVKSYAKKEGCYHITLNVWECNPGAKAFYEKMGLLPQKTVLETIL